MIIDTLFGWCSSSGGTLDLTRLGRGALAEAVAMTTMHLLEMATAARAGRVSSLGLLAPVELANASGRVAARGALLLLYVPRAATASTAQRVRLVMTLTEARRTLGHS